MSFVLWISLLLWFLQVSMADGCTNTKLLIISKPRAITCTLATWYTTDIYWSVRRPTIGGKETRIASCNGCTWSSPPCDCDTSDTDYSVTRTYISDGSSGTTLNFDNNVRYNDESIIKCSDVDNTSCVEIKLNVKDPWVPENIHVVVDSSLKVTGRADFVSSGENVICVWFYWSDNSTSKMVQGTTTLLYPFTDGNGLEYHRATCTMTMQLNASDMTYSFYVKIRPYGGLQFANAITIKKPRTTLTTTCPDYVSEGSDLTCECSHLTAQHGNPPATISWRDVTSPAPISWRDVTNTAVLHVPSVSRNQSGTQFVCTSVWGAGTEVVRSTLTYTLLVALKPGPNLTTTCPDYVSEGSDLTCECSHPTAQHGNPSATISWRDVTPPATMSSRDVTPPATISGRDVTPPATISWRYVTNTAVLHVPSVSRNQSGTQYVCTSVWGAWTEEEVRSTYIYTLVVADNPTPFPSAVVGVAVGVTVLVIVIVIAIAVAIVVVVHRRRASRKGAVKNNTEENAADNDFEEHINDLYQSSDLDTPPLADQCPSTSAQPGQQAVHLPAYSTVQVTNTVSADPNGLQEVTQTAQADDVYNVLGSAPRGDQKDGAVYNHLTKF